MAITWRDKRTDAPEPVSVLDEESNERDRQARRAGIRQQAAEIEIRRAPLAVLAADLQASQSRVDSASDGHSAATGPLQIELSELEQRAVSRIANREPPNSREDHARVEIIGRISAANVTLEKTILDERKVQTILAARVSAVACEFPDPAIVLSKLAHPGLASPALLVEKHVCECRSRWADARLTAARKTLDVVAANVAGIERGQRADALSRNDPSAWSAEVEGIKMSGDIVFERRNLARWTAEVQAASAELAQARADVRRNHAAIVNE